MSEKVDRWGMIKSMGYEEQLGFIRGYIGEAAAYEQLAEECAELAKAALKKARILRGDNPTPVTLEGADAALREECTDVLDCIDMARIKRDEAQTVRKVERWLDRIKESEERKR